MKQAHLYLAKIMNYAMFVHVQCTHSTDLGTHPQHLEPSVCEGDGEREKERERERRRERGREGGRERREGGREGGRRERGRERARERLRRMWLCLINTVC